MDKPELSVILATVNDSIACNLTCAHIIAQLEWDQIDYEILLIDNNSSPQEKEILEQFLQYHKNFPIRYFNFDVTGTIPIHAFGVEQAQGKYITMPEPHIILSPHYYRILLHTLKKLKEKNVEMVFSPFSTGSMLKKGDSYIGESPLVKHNPFDGGFHVGHCNMGDPIKSIFTAAFCGMICEKEWVLKIGNMFPKAFEKAGGYVAEALLLGMLTWMFGGKCYLQPKVVLEHPVYRIHKGAGRNEHVIYSLATAAYIAGGDKYLDLAKSDLGEEVIQNIKEDAQYAREYVEKNAKYSLDELVERWEVISQ